MKKRCIFLLLFGVFTMANAQVGNFRFGVHVDPVISWFSVSSDVVKNEGSVWGLNGGLIADNYFAENYAITTGLSLASSGGTIALLESQQMDLNDSIRTINANNEVTFRNQYIQIPLGIKLKTREFGYSTFFAQLGFTMQMNIKATASVTGQSSDLDAINEVKFFDMGYHFGGGLEYSLGGNTAIAVGLIYKNGFTDVTEGEGRVVMHSVSLRLGVMF